MVLPFEQSAGEYGRASSAAAPLVAFVLSDRFADDLFDRRGPREDRAQAGLAQARHAVLAGAGPQVFRRGVGDDQVADFVVDRHQFVDARAPAVAGVVAAVAAAAVVELLALRVRGP